MTDQHDSPEDNVPGDNLPESTTPETPIPEESVVESSMDSSDDEEVKQFTPDQKPVNFDETHKTTSPLETEVPVSDMLPIIREMATTVSKLFEHYASVFERYEQNETDTIERLRKSRKPLTDEEGNLWYRTFLMGREFSQLNETGEAAITREGSQWQQAIEHEGKTLRAGQPKQKMSANMSRDERLTYLTRKAGVGIVFDTPLYHSGVWLRFKTPPLVALTSLQYQLNQLKVSLGRESKGLAFSNISQSLMSSLTDFALQYVIEANVHFTTPADLKEKIKLLDAPALLWGLAVTLYPKGYPYAHPCVADPAKCNHITKETLNLNRLFWTDTLSLSQNQRKLMARRFDGKLTGDEERLYQSEMVRGGARTVWLNDLGLSLRVPNLLEFEEAGRTWIQGIVDLTAGAFNEPPHGENRNNYIMRLGISTTARQYAHWVTAVYEKDEDGTEVLITDELDVINDMLDQIFSTEEYVEEFLKAITTYMDDSIISLIAIPSFNCPACNTPAASAFNERFPHLVPIDVLTTFFTLVNQKLN